MKKILKEIWDIGIYVLVVLILTYLVITFLGQRTEVMGDSMMPTLMDQDHLLLDKITYRFHDPERFDIIVFPCGQNADAPHYIKRIIGLPGEKVYIDEKGDIYIDDVLLEESYGREIIRVQGTAATPIQLGADEYFVLGDNRNNSRDSRDSAVGNIQSKNIVGRAFARIWPLDKIGKIQHQ